MPGKPPPKSIQLTPGMTHSIDVTPVDNGGVTVRHSQYPNGPSVVGQKAPKPTTTYHSVAPSITIGGPMPLPLAPKAANPIPKPSKAVAKAAPKPVAKPSVAPAGKKPFIPYKKKGGK